MADVSGKGVPAALFMVIAKTLIKTRAQMGASPSEILYYVNNQLCEGNKAELFVTVWLAIIDLSTGEGIAANAGHEHPVICRKNGSYELVVYRHSPAVATLEDLRFLEHTFRLERGDKLFVYTDGVPEATDDKETLYGTERMLSSLNSSPGSTPEQLLNDVLQDVDAFEGNTTQFDDITMLSFYYFGSEDRNMSELTVEAKLDNLQQVISFVDEHLEEMGCPMKTQLQIDVAVEEAYVNVASYAYSPGTGPVTLKVEKSASEIRITFLDSGVPFNPLEKEDPDVSLPASERQIGGLGIFMVKKSMDNVQYAYLDGKNILTLTKKIL
jgi:sigma-B regulation protein RsbU (phosphoserine phosphatase)